MANQRGEGAAHLALRNDRLAAPEIANLEDQCPDREEHWLRRCPAACLLAVRLPDRLGASGLELVDLDRE